MKVIIRKTILMVSMAAVLSACGAQKQSTHDEHTDHASHTTADIQEKTSSASILPTFLKNQPDQVKLVYEAAGKATDILKWIPCYCGCGDEAGHTSNLNCFIKEVTADNSIVWDDHGTRCGVCLQIAVKSIQLKQEGKSLKEIRHYIDTTYKTGFAKPTKTPMPPVS